MITKKQAAIRREVARKFVRPEHMRAIRAASEDANCIISFREAGEHTLNKLALGAPAKGHDITEKSIKEKSIHNGYPPAQAEAILAALKNADLLGYVGHWNEAGELLGVHLGPDHQLGELVTDGVYKIDLSVTSLDGAYRVDMDRLNASLAPLKGQENWQALPYTGDYDLHDMISLYGQRATVPSNSDEEVRIINFINAYIAAFDKQRSFKSIEYNTVRHGAQVSYVAFARDKGEPIVPQVAESDFPLAFIYKGEWTIVRNREEHLAFYEKVGAKMKFPWLPRTETDIHRRDSR